KNSPFSSLSEFFRFNKDKNSPILCFTEYPNLTRQFIMENDGYKEVFGDAIPLVQVRGIIDGENSDVQIINSDGATEVDIAKGADLIVDNTQTGTSLKKAGLVELETIMHSSAGLYAGPSCDDEKMKKAQMIFDQLYGAITARKNFDVKFNIKNEMAKEVCDFLVVNDYCSDEPTVNSGSHFSQINVLIPKDRFPEMLNGIKKFNASSIVRSNVKQYVK
ncbi:MAG: ATP phosphoribosyltransferase, partial [Methanobrevibacter sp.]|nr:ATP phosphoribosyltransferase [Methanobrevibacter sp.]